MELDRELLQKLSEVDDEQLRSAMREIAAALGASKEQTEKATQNIGRYKRKIRNMTERDLERAGEKIGKDKLEEIIRNLKLN